MSTLTETKTGSSIDLLDSMKKGLGELATEGIKGGVKWAIGKGLNAAFGWESQEQKTRDWVESTLNEIVSELHIIKEDLAVLNTEVSQLAQLTETNAFLNVYNQMANKFQGYQTPLHATFDLFYELMVDLNNGNDANREARIQEIVGRGSELINVIAGMEDLLYSPELSTGRNLIQAWTDACITEMKFNEGDLESWYHTLEVKMRHFLRSLVLAYVLKINLEAYQEDLVNGPSKNGIAYYNSHISRKIKPILENFIQCVERMAISTYRPDINPEKSPDPVIQMASNAQLDHVFGRADLLAWFISSFDTQAASPGLFLRSLTRPSKLVNGQGQSQQPVASVSASTGHVVPIDPAYSGRGEHLTYWYKCMDYVSRTTNSAMQVRAFEDSDIRTIRYRWPEVGDALQPGAKVSASSGNPFYNRVYQWYSKDSLEPIAANQVTFDESGWPLNAALMASRTEADSLRENIFMNYLQPESSEGWAFDYKNGLRTDGIPSNTFSAYRVGSRFDGKLPFYAEARVNLTARSHSDRHERDAYVVLNVDYPNGSAPVDALLILDSNYKGEVQKLEKKQRAAKGHLDFFFKLDYTEGKYNGTVTRPEDFEERVGHDITSESKKKDYKNKSDKQVLMIPNSRIRMRWQFRFHIEKGSEMIAGGQSSSDIKWIDRRMYAKWNVENLRLAWPWPQLKIS